MTRRYALSDAHWERIKDLLPGQAGQPGATARDNRLFVDAVLYRYRAGIPWRDLPERFGDFRVVHTRHSRWSQSGVWQRIFDALAQDADNEYAFELTPPSYVPTSTALVQKGGSGQTGHWAQSWWPEHQNSYYGRCAEQSDGLSPDARAEP